MTFYRALLYIRVLQGCFECRDGQVCPMLIRDLYTLPHYLSLLENNLEVSVPFFRFFGFYSIVFTVQSVPICFPEPGNQIIFFIKHHSLSTKGWRVFESVQFGAFFKGEGDRCFAEVFWGMFFYALPPQKTHMSIFRGVFSKTALY